MSPPPSSRFNAEALTWDTNPSVLLATSLAHKSYLSHLPSNTTNLDILELGCGTGLLSLLLAPSVRSLTAVDPAEGMISALESKLSSSHAEVKNVRAVCATLEDADDERVGVDPVTGDKVEKRRFDVVVSHLVLHHVKDLEAFFKVVYGCLKPGGMVAVTDFENFGPEARRFHPEAKMEGVERHGVGRGEMRTLLEGAGFEGVSVETAFEMEKGVESVPGEGVKEEKMVFPFLICTGRKGE